jgi:hypothetical protein
LWTPPEGQIPSRAQGQPPPLLFDQFMREAFAQLANNPGLHHHLPFTPGDLGGPSHGHGNRTTGSNEHLLPPLRGQMPPPPQPGQPDPIWSNPFIHQALEAQLFNDPDFLRFMHDHGTTTGTGSNEHLLPPSGSQMPMPPPPHGQPHPMLFNPFNHPTLRQHLINDLMARHLRQQNRDDHHSPPTRPRSRSPSPYRNRNYREPQNVRII